MLQLQFGEGQLILDLVQGNPLLEVWLRSLARLVHWDAVSVNSLLSN